MFKNLVLGLATLVPVVWSYQYTAELCPQQCSETGLDPVNWTYYYNLDRLQHCTQPHIFQLTLQTPLDSIAQVIRGCSIGDASNATAASVGLVGGNATQPLTKKLPCITPDAPVDIRDSNLQITPFTATSSIASATIIDSIQHLKKQLVAENDCNDSVLFVRSGDIIVGLYAGSQVQKTSAAAVVQQFSDLAESSAFPASVAAEVCNELQGVIHSSQTVGLYVATDGNVEAARQALASWNNGKCLVSASDKKTVPVKIQILSAILGGGAAAPATNKTFAVRGAAATCSYVQAVKDDNCWSLATQKCKISTDDFYKYNTNGDSDKFCSGVLPGDYVCCSAGDKPDFSPKPNADGTCAKYVAGPGDYCSVIAAKNQIKDWRKLDDYNKQTWGWRGCLVGVGLNQVLCVSEGKPNMPSQDKDIICGPQVVGTQKPTNDTDWALLNQCPLNACCDVWGQCGTTTEFCVDTRDKSTMAPGTAKNNTNGCISNCGTDITNQKSPVQFSKVGYFESWNMDRK
jgi:chitinase